MTLPQPGPTGSASAGSSIGLDRERLTLAVAGAGILLLLLLFRGTAGSIVRLWYDDNAYSHGFLILPIAGWLVWQRRAALLAAAPRPTVWGLLPLAAAATAWLMAQVVSVQMVSQFALAAMIDALALTLLGFRAFRVLAFPALFLFAAVPFGQGVTPQLQAWTANIAVQALRAVGTPVFQDGLQITTPIGNFAVADECSGLRFLTATITLAILFASEFYRTWARRAAFLVLAIVIPIVSNGLRVFTVILLAHAFGLEFAASVDHVIYGWVFLTLVTGVLLLIGWSFREAPAAATAPRPADRSTTRRPARDALVAAGAFGILIAATATDGALARIPGPIADLALPAAGAPLDAAAIQALPWQPKLPGADARRVDQELVDGRPVTRVVAYYAWQRQGAKAASDAANLAPDDWTRLSFGKADVSIDGQSVAVQRLVVAHGRQHWLIYAWYWVDDRFTGSAAASKLLQIRGLLAGRNAGAAIVMAAPFDGNESPAEAERALTRALAQQEGLSRALAHAGSM
ncbi:exosortase A [Aliidongia dinghuensis]|uniref:exosortase A n=1 Tax=Aliidongia dinghuensis TaxID=1867774 RepID=UPI00166A3601|nr:exosortase A [Aliidongia dinghuensis]